MVERRINKMVCDFIKSFKEDIKVKIDEHVSAEDLVQFVFDYPQISIDKEDFTKRKRVKNVVPGFDRCSAKRANFDQCTRKKKPDCEYCGTHMKGIPHGVIECVADTTPQFKKVSVWAQDVSGIIYYFDDAHNVYQAEDIISNKTNPAIIATYRKEGEKYVIDMK